MLPAFINPTLSGSSAQSVWAERQKPSNLFAEPDKTVHLAELHTICVGSGAERDMCSGAASASTRTERNMGKNIFHIAI